MWQVQLSRPLCVLTRLQVLVRAAEQLLGSQPGDIWRGALGKPPEEPELVPAQLEHVAESSAGRRVCGVDPRCAQECGEALDLARPGSIVWLAMHGGSPAAWVAHED